MIQLYHNPRCAKSRAALKALEESTLPFTVILYLEQPPKEGEIKVLIKKLNGPLQDIIRIKEPVFKDVFKGSLTDPSAIVDAIVKAPILLERPLLVSAKEALVARSPEKINEFLNRHS